RDWSSDVCSSDLLDLLDNSPLIDEELRQKLKTELTENIIAGLSREAAALPLDDEAELAVDWLNGRRTPDADQTLKGAISGLNLGSDAPRVFRALVEATCFGARAIVGRFREEGVPV